MNSVPSTNNEFDEIVAIIEQARQKAFRAVNRELIEMYWQIGQYISEKVKSNAWAEACRQHLSLNTNFTYPTKPFLKINSESYSNSSMRIPTPKTNLLWPSKKHFPAS
jgi:hypothetical protein